MKKLLKKVGRFILNTNTGYYLKEVYYTYQGKTEMGFLIRRGYRFLCIKWGETVEACEDIYSVNEAVNRLKITLK